MSEGEIDTVQVTSRGETSGSGDLESDQDVFTLSVDEAINRLASGDIELSSRQAKPPFALYEHAKGLLENPDVIGPEFTSPKALERASEAFWKGGKPNAMINGCEIRWFYQAIEPELCKVLTDGIGKGPNLFRRLDLVLSHRVEHTPRRSYEVEQSVREQETKGLLPLNTGSSVPIGETKAYVYHVIGPDWHSFRTAMAELRKLRHQFLQTCLKRGRVLVVDDFNRHSGLISPTRWQREAFIEGKDVNYHFVLSKDLPRQWINASKGPGDKAERQGSADAIKWLESECAKLGSVGKPKRKDDLIAEMCARFEISKNAAEQAWTDAAIPEWKRAGRPPKRK
jgi:hypothetical protein